MAAPLSQQVLRFASRNGPPPTTSVASCGEEKNKESLSLKLGHRNNLLPRLAARFTVILFILSPA